MLATHGYKNSTGGPLVPYNDAIKDREGLIEAIIKHEMTTGSVQPDGAGSVITSPPMGISQPVAQVMINPNLPQQAIQEPVINTQAHIPVMEATANVTVPSMATPVEAAPTQRQPRKRISQVNNTNGVTTNEVPVAQASFSVPTQTVTPVPVPTPQATFTPAAFVPPTLNATPTVAPTASADITPIVNVITELNAKIDRLENGLKMIVGAIAESKSDNAKIMAAVHHIYLMTVKKDGPNNLKDFSTYLNQYISSPQ